MGATLSLRKPGASDPYDEPVAAPVAGLGFKPDEHFGEVHGMHGVAFVQGKALFNIIRQYVGPAPKEMWLAPLTKEQEDARRMQHVKNRKFFGSVKPIATGASVPQAIVNAERENAQARAVESRAG